MLDPIFQWVFSDLFIFVGKLLLKFRRFYSKIKNSMFFEISMFFENSNFFDVFRKFQFFRCFSKNFECFSRIALELRKINTKNLSIFEFEKIFDNRSNRTPQPSICPSTRQNGTPLFISFFQLLQIPRIQLLNGKSTYIFFLQKKL
jgi:hypothetical protein